MITRIISDSHFDLELLYRNYSWLNKYSINDYQLLTVIWNIFLVFIPLVIILYANIYWRKTGLKIFKQKIIMIFLGIIWLLFLPNSAYIITDIRHLLDYCPTDSLNRVCVSNAWMIAFFFLYAGLGWVSYFYLLNQGEKLLTEIFNQRIARLFIFSGPPFFSLGTLLGLINRWNSWDIFIYPLQLINSAIIYVTNYHYLIDWLAFTALLYLLYFGGKLLFKDSDTLWII